MTGREVTLTLAISPSLNAPPLVEEARVLLLPVSEKRKARAFREAEAYIAECNRIAEENKQPSQAPSTQDERGLRFLCAAMRDAEDARKLFVDSDKVDAFRDIIISEQMRLLLAEYEELILREYAEVRTAAELQQMKAEAKENFTSGQG